MVSLERAFQPVQVPKAELSSRTFHGMDMFYVCTANAIVTNHVWLVGTGLAAQP